MLAASVKIGALLERAVMRYAAAPRVMSHRTFTETGAPVHINNACEAC